VWGAGSTRTRKSGKLSKRCHPKSEQRAQRTARHALIRCERNVAHESASRGLIGRVFWPKLGKFQTFKLRKVLRLSQHLAITLSWRPKPKIEHLKIAPPQLRPMRIRIYSSSFWEGVVAFKGQVAIFMLWQLWHSIQHSPFGSFLPRRKMAPWTFAARFLYPAADSMALVQQDKFVIPCQLQIPDVTGGHRLIGILTA